jgi:mono/diheme cytochrome c family protein
MKYSFIFTWVIVSAIVAIAGVIAAQNTPPITSPPVFAPDLSHESDRLPGTVIRWDSTMQTTNVPQGTATGHFVFNFINVWSNSVVIVNVHPSCGCTTAQLPHLPWTIVAGTNGQIGVTVNLAGKFGTIIKTVHVGTSRGSIDLIVQITIVPLQLNPLTDAQLAQQMAIAHVDREAVFKNDCANCHMKPGQYKYGKDLFDADCAICHEAKFRASMVPDLGSLKVATNEDFWRTWIAHGKAGSFMPAFSIGDGGPLNDMQIASLAAYLDAEYPSKVPSPQ